MPSRPSNSDIRRGSLLFLRIGMALFTLSVLVWGGTLAYEVSGLSEGKKVSLGGGLLNFGGAPSSADDLLLRKDTPDAEVSSKLKSGLPRAMDGWVVQGPQPVPGTDGSVVECIFNPRSDERSLVAPQVVYVQLRKSKSDQGGGDELTRARADRYPEGVGRIVFEGQEFEVGYSADSRSYFMGFADGDIAYAIDASFTDFVPGEDPIGKLKGAAQEIAKEVLNQYKKSRSSL